MLGLTFVVILLAQMHRTEFIVMSLTFAIALVELAMGAQPRAWNRPRIVTSSKVPHREIANRLYSIGRKCNEARHSALQFVQCDAVG